MEEEQKLHSQQPKVMKKWQDSRKNEKLIQNGDVPKDKNTSNIKDGMLFKYLLVISYPVLQSGPFLSIVHLF